MTPMSFNQGGAGNNFLGISPGFGKEGQQDGEASSKKSSTLFSVSYQQHQWGGYPSLSPASFYTGRHQKQTSPFSRGDKTKTNQSIPG